MTPIKTHLLNALAAGVTYEATQAKQLPKNSPEYKERAIRAALLIQAAARIKQQPIASV